MQKWLVCAAAALLLNACADGVSGSGVSLGVGLGGIIGRHVGLGTSINIPLGGVRTSSGNNSGINVIDHKIITYFDAQGKAIDKEAGSSYYRELLAKEGSSFKVQDFYTSGQKRTDAMVLTREDVFTFRAHPQNGQYTVYAINGTVMQQTVYKNGVAKP